MEEKNEVTENGQEGNRPEEHDSKTDSKHSKRMSFLYAQGYTAALTRVAMTLANLQSDMKWHKRRQSYKEYKAIIECMIRNRTELRENPDAFVRCNDKVKGGYEVVIDVGEKYPVPCEEVKHDEVTHE